MKLANFKVEQWMDDYEMQAKYNLTDTCAMPLSLKELLDMESIDLDLILDYGMITGSDEVKEGILSLYESGNFENVTTCHGCLEANTMIMDTLLEAGDHVITFEPGYQQFMEMPKSIGCQVSILPLHKPNWQPDIEEVREAIQSNTKMVILNNPNNPTGILFNEGFILDLIEECKKSSIYILCDEAYRGFTKQKSISDQYEKGISTGSLSKVFSLAGLRYGWIKANRDVIHQINVRRDYVMISTGPLLDALASIAFKHKDVLIERNRSVIETNKSIIQDWLKKNPSFHLALPEASTVSFLKYDFNLPSEQFAKEVLNQIGVFFVPGSCFGYENYLRLGLGRDPKNFKAGLEQLSLWCKQNIKNN